MGIAVAEKPEAVARPAAFPAEQPAEFPEEAPVAPLEPSQPVPPPQGGISIAEIDLRFTYHAPNPKQLIIYYELRERARLLAKFINTFTPDSREQSSAITKLEEAVFWANAAIARRTGQ